MSSTYLMKKIIFYENWEELGWQCRGIRGMMGTLRENIKDTLKIDEMHLFIYDPSVS